MRREKAPASRSSKRIDQVDRHPKRRKLVAAYNQRQRCWQLLWSIPQGDKWLTSVYETGFATRMDASIRRRAVYAQRDANRAKTKLCRTVEKFLRVIRDRRGRDICSRWDPLNGIIGIGDGPETLGVRIERVQEKYGKSLDAFWWDVNQALREELCET